MINDQAYADIVIFRRSHMALGVAAARAEHLFAPLMGEPPWERGNNAQS